MISVLLWTTFLSAYSVNTCSSNSEEQIRYLWNWAYTLKSQMYWVSAVLNWVFLKFMLTNTTVPYIFYTRRIIYIAYSLFHLPFIIPGFKNNWVFQKNNWVNTQQSSLSVSVVTVRKPFTCIHLHVLWSTDIWGASKPLNKHLKHGK